MDKKTLPWIILLVGILLFNKSILDMIFPTPKGVPGSTTNQVAQVQQPLNAPTNAPAPAIGKGLLGLVPPTTNTTGQIEILTNAQCRVEFSSLGGGIKQIILHDFSDNGHGSVSLNDQSPLPMGAVAATEDVTFWTPCQLTTVSNQVHAVSESSNGLVVTREYTLMPNYQIVENVTLKNTGTNALDRMTLQLGVGMAEPMDARDTGEYLGFSFMTGEKPVHEALASLKKQVDAQHKPFERVVPIDWVAVKNQYFVQLITPATPFAEIHVAPFALPQDKDPRATKNPSGVLAVAATPSFSLPPGGSTNWTFSLYTGPKEYKILTLLDKGQDDLLELNVWGMSIFKPFSRALLWMLDIFHSMFHNWGVAIIVVTIVIKIIFWPLTAMSTRSMKQMQALSPKMTAIKEKYKDDQKKQNEEIMKMYRDYKINPMAGCLPVLVQIPIFIAFYNLLRTSIELRGASFLWIKDLSMPDTVWTIPGLEFPVNLMPLIMVVTMIWQMKVTPQAPNVDPAMKMMMWIMPVMFLWICYGYSSGLSLYWTFQNILTIVQTRLTRDQPVEPPQKVKRKAGFTFSRPVDKKK